MEGEIGLSWWVCGENKLSDWSKIGGKFSFGGFLRYENLHRWRPSFESSDMKTSILEGNPAIIFNVSKMAVKFLVVLVDFVVVSGHCLSVCPHEIFSEKSFVVVVASS